MNENIDWRQDINAALEEALRVGMPLFLHFESPG